MWYLGRYLAKESSNPQQCKSYLCFVMLCVLFKARTLVNAILTSALPCYSCYHNRAFQLGVRIYACFHASSRVCTPPPNGS